MKTIQLMLLTLVLNSSMVIADTVELTNGKKIEGTFIGRDGDTVKFKVDGMSMTFQAKDVKNISMGSAAASTSTKTATKAAPAPAAKGPATIAAGTNVTIKLTGTLDTGKHSKGHKFSGVLEGGLSSNGVMVAPAGSKVHGVVTESVKARRASGNAKMMITLTDISIGGSLKPIQTSGINAGTASTTGGTVKKTARAAALGGLIDGSKGAKTGAKVGLGAAILTPGQQVVIPAGTLLDFQLTQALKK
ncbi:MAG: hypothetical protein ACC707_17510 [Thiohalomonadales bacterium]